MFSKKELVPLVITKNDSYFLPYCLESIRGYFEKTVWYDVASNDGSAEIFDYYKRIFDRDGTEVIFEQFPEMTPRQQIALKNAQIAEAGSEYYYTLDSDELLNEKSITTLEDEFPKFTRTGQLYGVVNRIEIDASLEQAYSPNSYTKHHRVYHRTCTWKQTHPGEVARITQRPANEYKFSRDVTVFHFHGALRSPNEGDALKRLERKDKPTYRPGQLESFDLFGNLPILKEQMFTFDPNPQLADLQKRLK